MLTGQTVERHLSGLGRGDQHEAFCVRNRKGTEAHRHEAARARALRQWIVAASVQHHDFLPCTSNGLEEVIEEHTAPHGVLGAVDAHVDWCKHIAIRALHSMARKENDGDLFAFALFG